jgi:D-alanine-D-alanine ligase
MQTLTNRFARQIKKFVWQKIGILCGGSSSEREISLKSAESVYSVLMDQGLNITKIDIDERRSVKQIQESNITLAFIAMHGKFGEDGVLQEVLENLEIPYTGSGIKASQLAMDKVASKKVFSEKGIKTPEYEIFVKNRNARLNGINFPVVVKPSSQGSSVGLTILDYPLQLQNALEIAFQFDERAIVESYIEGREITVGIFNECPLPVIEIIPKRKFFDFEAKYVPGNTDYEIPADIKPEYYKAAQEIAISAHKALNCRDFSRVDMILSKDGKIFVLEVNTIPGLTSTSLLPKSAKVAGIDFMQLCLKMLEMAISRQRKGRNQ